MEDCPGGRPAEGPQAEGGEELDHKGEGRIALLFLPPCFVSDSLNDPDASRVPLHDYLFRDVLYVYRWSKLPFYSPIGYKSRPHFFYDVYIRIRLWLLGSLTKSFFPCI